jgi:hypothetical protein
LLDGRILRAIRRAAVVRTDPDEDGIGAVAGVEGDAIAVAGKIAGSRAATWTCVLFLAAVGAGVGGTATFTPPAVGGDDDLDDTFPLPTSVRHHADGENEDSTQIAQHMPILVHL